MDGSLWERKDGSLWREIKIPTNNEFLIQYHQWIHRKVADKFRRDKDRVLDSVQNVRVRLMQKDFIGRWFFKHLTHELVDRTQAELILGRDMKLKFISVVQPVVGKRSEPDSLWRISDLLEYAKFDHERFYYSIQGHTIDSDSMLRLLGYPAGSYNALKSLYKQGRIKPAELTQHNCTEVLAKASPINGMCSIAGCGKKHFSRGFCTTHYGQNVVQQSCAICDKGRAGMRARGVSLADDWMKSPEAAASLRWEDSQLRPFLRQWRGQNLVVGVPQKIVRPDGQTGPYQGIEAGLLKYAWIIVDHEVVNDFKRMSRTLDASCMVFNDGLSPNVGGDENVVGWEADDNGEKPQMVVKDASAIEMYKAAENEFDIMTMIQGANLTPEEQEAILEIDLKDSNVRDFADKKTEDAKNAAMAAACKSLDADGNPCKKCDACASSLDRVANVSIAHVHRVRNSALEKMRHVDVPDAFINGVISSACQKYGCTPDEVLGPDRIGPCVPARAEFFYNLSKLGLSVDEMSAKTGVSKDRIATAIGRASLKRPMLPESSPA